MERSREQMLVIPASSELTPELLARSRRCAEAAAEFEQTYKRTLDEATAVVREALGAPNAEVMRLGSVDGRLIFVVDGAVSERDLGELLQNLSRAAFRRTNFAGKGNAEFKHHICEHNVMDVSKTGVFNSVMKLAQVCFPSHCPLACERIYTNSRFFGDVSFVHRDSDNASSVTALVYPNPEWGPELGGETLFYDERGTIVENCEPSPGRIVIFNGSIWHKGSPPGRLLHGARFTTAFKFDSARRVDEVCAKSPNPVPS